MPNLLPVQWKETLERLHDKSSHFLENLKRSKKSDHAREYMSDDQLPAFMQFGGPTIDVRDSGAELIVEAEIPGLKKDDITLELVGRRLLIRGEKKISREQHNAGGSYISECRYGSFARNILLPCDVNDGTIRADLKNGVLFVHLQKQLHQQSQSHRVPIT